MDDEHIKQQADRLRALWKSGRDKYVSFFSVLNEVRQSIGDQALPNWCFDELRIGISVILDARRLLTAVDANIVKDDLAAARAAHKQRKWEERAAAAKAREAEQTAKSERKALEAAEKVKLEEEKKEASRRERKQFTDRRHRERTKKQKLVAYAATAENAEETCPDIRTSQNVVQLPDVELAQKIKLACSRLTASRIEWIEASIELAVLLCEGKSRFGDNLTAFGEWLDRNDITLSKNDRAALLNLGSDSRAMRLTLEQTNRVSYEMIWRDVERRLIGNDTVAL